MTRPTVLFHGEDAGEAYYFWQWITPEVSEPQIHVVSRADLNPLLAELRSALPSDLPDEVGTDRAVTRMLDTGPFRTPTAERELSAKLSRAVLPRELAREIVAAAEASGEPVLLRTLPAPSCASIPWELLPVDPDDPASKRLVEYADVAADPPVGIYAGRAEHPKGWSDEVARRPVVHVIDPDSLSEGQVLDPDPRRALFKRLTGRTDAPYYYDRRQLSKDLRASPPPGRLFYLGHVASSDEQPGATSMLLSDPPEMFGVIGVMGTGDNRSRPFSAFDAVEGTQYRAEREREVREAIGTGPIVWPNADDDEEPKTETGAEIWPMPERVALLACNSGGDLAHAEPFGLVIAFLNSGAGLVTATRWALPVDRAFQLRVPGAVPLTEMALALDGFHKEPDPVAAIGAWQRERLAAWNDAGDDASAIALSPVLWAALTTYLGPRKDPVPLTPEELAMLTGENVQEAQETSP